LANTRQLYATTPMTAQHVSEIIGTIFEDLIGTYQYDEGTSRPAICINKPIENRELLQNVECVVSAAPRTRDRQAYWMVYFLQKCFEDDPGILGCISERMRSLFSTGIKIDYLPGDKTIEAIPQVHATLPMGLLFVLRKKLRIPLQ